MESLPLIPGYSFSNPCIRDYKLKQKLDYKNGYRVTRDSFVGTGRRPVDSASSAYSQARYDGVLEYDPSLTYGRSRAYPVRQVLPHYALFAQKCLNFKAFFRQSVFNSPVEHFRVRHVNIIYFLEDDTMCVIEPPVDNAGFLQGKLVRRGKIPRGNTGRFYHWKDLNVGLDIEIYGVVYHTVDCDAFTAEFLRSQGIDPGLPEAPPLDTYTQDRLAKLAATKVPTNFKKTRPPQDDPRRRFLEFDGMVLTFDATWNGDLYQIMYFLTDDAIAVKELLKPNSGKDPNRMLLKKTKVPKNWTDLPIWYPSIYMERSDEEVVEYYGPLDFKVGETIFIYGRQFLLYDCDAFTRRYYRSMLGVEQPARVPTGIPETPDIYPAALSARPCKPLHEKPRKEDVIRKLLCHPKKLRYLMSMVAVHPEDEGREFILQYNLADGTIKIVELGKQNSGRQAGCFLNSILLPKTTVKSDCQEEVPIYYTPEDFYIGAQINVFNRRFVITGADLFVLKYVEANRDKFSAELIQNIREYFNQTPQEEQRPQEDVKEDTVEELVAKYEKEPLMPARKETDSPADAQQIIASLPEPPSQSPCEFSRPTTGHTPKQITWADQVRIPCALTSEM